MTQNTTVPGEWFARIDHDGYLRGWWLVLCFRPAGGDAFTIEETIDLYRSKDRADAAGVCECRERNRGMAMRPPRSLAEAAAVSLTIDGRAR